MYQLKFLSPAGLLETLVILFPLQTLNMCTLFFHSRIICHTYLFTSLNRNWNKQPHSCFTLLTRKHERKAVYQTVNAFLYVHFNIRKDLNLQSFDQWFNAKSHWQILAQAYNPSWCIPSVTDICTEFHVPVENRLLCKCEWMDPLDQVQII